ncbi:MAG: phosphatidate cytidylyltransferase [Ruthenibacterium lactatiformans]|nr:phosphatidate cytidylyltransferase [Ruthenibacterium lactatiformans]MEE1461977.1 phosphatidate cytidylyltransferase [Ruthenibacterium lactatiformans]
MKTRVITSAVGLVVLFAVMALFDTFVFNVVIAAICLLAIHEVFKAFRFEKAAYIYWGFVPYTLLVMFSDFHMVRICMLPASYIFALYLVLCVIGNSKSINYAKLGGMVLFSCISMFCFYSLIYLKQLLPRATYGYDALYFIFLILGFAWGGDSAAYFAGRAFGKHKLAPVVSPNKTIEGAVGGVMGSMLLGVVVTACYTALHGQLVGVPLDTLGWRYYVVVVLLGGFGSLLGIVGDLFASVIKRQCGIKDYGTIFPGHGGIMDRFDSVLFIAPFVAMVVTAVFYYFTK